MHQEATNKFNARNGMFLPPAFFTVILYIEGNRILIHADNTVVADGNPEGVFSEIVNNGLSAIKGFLAVWNPLLFITNVQEFLEGVMVTILFAASMKLKLFLFPEGFEFSHVFAAKEF